MKYAVLAVCQIGGSGQQDCRGRLDGVCVGGRSLFSVWVTRKVLSHVYLVVAVVICV